VLELRCFAVDWLKQWQILHLGQSIGTTLFARIQCATRSTLFMLVTEVFVRDGLGEDTFARGEWVYLMLSLYSLQFVARK